MLTRKQQWRRTRTRKHAWGDLPPDVLEAMIAAGAGGMPKSVSWDHSYAAGLKMRADKAAEAARRVAKEDSRVKAAEAAAAEAVSMKKSGGEAVHIPRSVSCSSLAEKRTLFPRNSSKHELGTTAAARRVSVGRRRMLPHRRGVSFDTQVKMVLIPKREEFSDSERSRLWWGRDDYARFRQVLIDWKRANVHRISHSDNILSIDLGDIDDEDTRDHDEAVAAADAMAAAAAAAAVTTAAEAAEAAAAAAAAAAATAAEVAAARAREEERSNLEAAVAAAAAAAAANMVGGLEGGVGPEYLGEDGMLAEIAEEGDADEGRREQPVRSLAPASFNLGVVGGERAVPDWSANGGANGMVPLRRAFTFDQGSPPAPPGHLKEVALSELQSTTEALRAWRRTFDSRNAMSDMVDEERGRAVSMQQQDKLYAYRGRATAKLSGHDRNEGGRDNGRSDGLATGETGDGEVSADRDGGVSIQDERRSEEKQQRTLSDQSSPHTSTATTKSPVIAAFERQQREAEVLRREDEAEEQARASAMVEAAAAAAAGAAASAGRVESFTEGCSAESSVAGQVVQLGLNDSPGSAAAAAAVGIRMASDGVSNLSLRARDSVENLQELGKRPLPLSSSA